MVKKKMLNKYTNATPEEELKELMRRINDLKFEDQKDLILNQIKLLEELLRDGKENSITDKRK